MPEATDKVQLLEQFKDMLPASLGVPYVVNTIQKPYLFVAFYNAKRHELEDGRIINGNEIRLWKPSAGFKKAACPLAGVFGVEETDCKLVLCALVDQGTRRHEIMPYQSMIRDMIGHIGMNAIGTWDLDA